MASLMENLIEVLENESIEYEGLLNLSQKKTAVIVSGNLDELQKITDEEQFVVSRINNLERKRVETTADIANVLNRDVESLKLPKLIELMAARPEEQRKLAAAHDSLQGKVYELKRVNEQNSELLANALEMVEFEMTLLQAAKTAPATANYSKSAYNTGDTMGIASKGFDAKQ